MQEHLSKRARDTAWLLPLDGLKTGKVRRLVEELRRGAIGGSQLGRLEICRRARGGARSCAAAGRDVTASLRLKEKHHRLVDLSAHCRGCWSGNGSSRLRHLLLLHLLDIVQTLLHYLVSLALRILLHLVVAVVHVFLDVGELVAQVVVVGSAVVLQLVKVLEDVFDLAMSLGDDRVEQRGGILERVFLQFAHPVLVCVRFPRQLLVEEFKHNEIKTPQVIFPAELLLLVSAQTCVGDRAAEVGVASRRLRIARVRI